MTLVVAASAIGGFLARMCWRRRARIAAGGKPHLLPINGDRDVLASAMPAGTKEITTMANLTPATRRTMYNYDGSSFARLFDASPAYSSTDNLEYLRHHRLLSSTSPSDTTGMTAATAGHGGADLHGAMSVKEKELEAGYNRLTVGDFAEDDSSMTLSPVSSRRTGEQYLPQYRE